MFMIVKIKNMRLKEFERFMKKIEKFEDKTKFRWQKLGLDIFWKGVRVASIRQWASNISNNFIDGDIVIEIINPKSRKISNNEKIELAKNIWEELEYKILI